MPILADNPTVRRAITSGGPVNELGEIQVVALGRFVLVNRWDLQFITNTVDRMNNFPLRQV